MQALWWSEGALSAFVFVINNYLWPPASALVLVNNYLLERSNANGKLYCNISMM